jgi:hypothetical protein
MDMLVTWGPHKPNRPDAAMTSESCTPSINVIRRAALKGTSSDPVPAEGSKYLAVGNAPGAGIAVHLATVTALEAGDDGVRVVIQYIGKPETGNKICSPHGTRHVSGVVADSAMPYVLAIGQAEKGCGRSQPRCRFACPAASASQAPCERS